MSASEINKDAPWESFAAPTGDPAAAPPPAAGDTPWLDYATSGSWVDPVMQGLTFGFADEIAGAFGGAMDALTGRGSFEEGYDRTLAKARKQTSDFATRNPVTSTALEVVGSLPTAVLPVGTLMRGASTASKAVRGAGLAATESAIYGFGAGEGGPQERLKSAATQGAIGAGLGAATPIIGRQIGKVIPKPRHVKAEALARSGIPETMPTVVENRGVAGVAQGLNQTLMGAPISRAFRKQNEAAGRRAEDLAASLSPVADKAGAGESLQKGAKGFVDEVFGRRQDKLYDAAKKLINPADTSDLGRVRQKIADIKARVADPDIRKFVTDKNWADMEQMVNDAATRGVSFDDLRALRTAVRKMRDASDSAVGINKAAVREIYDALSRDMYDLAGMSGGLDAMHAVRRADAYTRAFETGRRPILDRTIDATSGEKAYADALRWAQSGTSADWRALAALRRSMPRDEWRDFSATVIREMGKSTAGAVEEGFSPAVFLTSWRKLSDKGKDALFAGRGTPPGLRRDLDDLATSAEELKRVTSLGNPSGTTRVAAGMLTGVGMHTALLYDPKLAAVLAGGAAGSWVLAKAMSSPRFVKWLTGVNRMRAQQARSANPMTMTRAQERWLAAIPGISGQNQELHDMMRAIVLDEKPGGGQ